MNAGGCVDVLRNRAAWPEAISPPGDALSAADPDALVRAAPLPTRVTAPPPESIRSPASGLAAVPDKLAPPGSTANEYPELGAISAASVPAAEIADDCALSFRPWLRVDSAPDAEMIPASGIIIFPDCNADAVPDRENRPGVPPATRPARSRVETDPTETAPGAAAALLLTTVPMSVPVTAVAPGSHVVPVPSVSPQFWGSVWPLETFE